MSNTLSGVQQTDEAPGRMLQLMGNLYSATTGLSALYVAAALTHAQMRGQLDFLAVMVWLAVSGLLLFGLRWCLGRIHSQRRDIKWIGISVGGLILSISLFHLFFLAASPGILQNLLLLTIGVGIFFVPFRMHSLVLITTLGFWVLLSWSTVPTSGWLFFAFGLLATGGLRLQKEILRVNGERQLAIQAAANEQVKREETERALQESQERYALIARGTNDGIWDWDLASGSIYFSPRWKSMIGCREDDISSDPKEWFERIHPEDRLLVENSIAAHVNGARESIECEYRLRHQEGDYRWMICRALAARDAAGRAIRIAGSQTDVTAQRRTEQQVYYAASHDQITGLPNRALFLELLDGALRTSRRYPDARSAVLLLGLDRFNVLKDGLGPSGYDELLRSLADRIKSCLPSDEILARIEGGDFAMLIKRATDLAAVMRLVSQIQDKIAAPFLIGDQCLSVSCSMGIVASNARYESVEEVLRDARTAMQQARAQGTGNPELFYYGMHTELIESMRLENELRLGIERGELTLLYQPIFSLETGSVAGLETDIRWRHPTHGQLDGEAFLPAAERAGLSRRILWWTLEEACRQLREWKSGHPELRPVFLSVPISAADLTQSQFIGFLEDCHEKFEVRAGELALRIQDQPLLHREKVPKGLISRLKTLGVEFHLEELGTAHTALTEHPVFPTRAVRVHRNLISRIDDHPAFRVALAAIVNLIHTFAMETIADGIETETQLQILTELNCTYGVGPALGSALDGDAVFLTLAEQSRTNPGLLLRQFSRAPRY